MSDGEWLQRDSQARADALDVTRSFLVQAPAGSGKTELLIQRLLALLARVDEPERILALTFTRKAAGEMRERVLEALASAHRGDPLPADKPHLAITRSLAQAALAQDASRGWALMQHPSRLRIVTFDSLTTWIVRNAPFAAALGPAPGYVDDAQGLYAVAAAQAVVAAAADDPHWRRLLVHVHNDADRLAQLLSRLLARRDQLGHQVGLPDPRQVREALANALTVDVRSALMSLDKAWPEELKPEVARLAGFAAETLAGSEAAGAFARELAACAACAGLPPATVEALPLWRTLDTWLLTKKGELRARVDKNTGFPRAATGARGAAAKRAMDGLLARLRAVPGLAEALRNAATLPAPDALGGAAGEVVDALLAILPRTIAQLDLAFADMGQVDFVQAALAALEALGDAEAPSDLLQRLDYRIGHLLVDEFQDTSATQLEVLSRLTAGWTPGEDGRTLFAVGDPMQSIYRFREAEVRLFVEAQRAGALAGIPVECLTLRRNFRSQPRIVDWVNATFPAVLGSVSDPTRGAVAFEPAVATHAPHPHDSRTFTACASDEEEAAAVVRYVLAAKAQGAQSIAILVRARAHLAAILPALRAAGERFVAVELDALGERQAIGDLASLTHALLQPGDRVAWLAVLRAPWCGLVLADLLVLAEAAPPPRALASVLDDPAVLMRLSPDGRGRLARVQPILAAALATHGRARVTARVRGAWLALGGPACLDDALDLDAAERYFACLAEHERASDVPEWDVFTAALGELRASSEASAEGAVQVMTMHKAKGLEFDVVILPGLGRQGRGVTHELLRWRARRGGLLIASSPSPGADPDPLYEYLKRLEKEEEGAELGRLLYVACTRAKSRLHLCAVPAIKENAEGILRWQPVGSSALARLWTALSGEAAPPPAPREDAAFVAPPLPLARMPAGFRVQVADDGLAPAAVTLAPPSRDVAFDWAQERARVVGTLAHRLLARVGEGAAFDAAALTPRVRADLASAGLAGAELELAARLVLDAVRRTLADPRGRWLFDPGHAQARSEWPLAGVDAGEVVHVVLDRTFVAGGERWIVDFKTGTHEGGDVEAFLAREAERYGPQLARYGRLVRALEGRPVRLALYYPLVEGGFRELVAA